MDDTVNCAIARTDSLLLTAVRVSADYFLQGTAPICYLPFSGIGARCQHDTQRRSWVPGYTSSTSTASLAKIGDMYPPPIESLRRPCKPKGEWENPVIDLFRVSASKPADAVMPG